MSDYLAVDVETANTDRASICQIGLVEFDGTGPLSSWQSLVNPEEPFDGMNISIHGITPSDVADAPTFANLYEGLRTAMTGRVVASHTPFDEVAIRRACERYRLPSIDCRWLDSARVARRTWPEFSRSGYGLGRVALKLGIAFDHHVAKEDARAAGAIILHAIAASGLSVDQWLTRQWSRSALRALQNVAATDQAATEPNPLGPLFGEVAVFTGELSISRDEAEAMAFALGCEVGAGVTRRTTLLVLGDQDQRKLAGYSKSSKHRRAEELIAKGHAIRIVGEPDFRALALSEVTA